MNEKTLTSSAGHLEGDNQNSRTGGPRGPVVLQNFSLFEQIAIFGRERVPERVIQGKSSSVYGFSVSFAEPSSWSVSNARRCLDFSVALLTFLLCWPFLLLSALAVFVESHGPVIFRQTRVGKDGRLFTVYKLRTMDLTTQRDGPLMTKRGDPRVTKCGRFLRKHKLDELPQLINVLRGDMSLVGPRPRLPHHTDVRTLPVRPGLTGAATLAFRREEEMLQFIPDDELEHFNSRMIIPLKGKLDWDYMRRATLASDIALLYKTAACCIPGRPNAKGVDRWRPRFSSQR
ncbi:MAG TPA: sugar transferase [Acidobacteriaceae bacterium]